ncbi:MAG: hypothetical protein JXB04_10365 [Kiritimatiellae bacterium]|nr:hypothetical protein [Kiritimatiellia bacterium]
MKVFGGYYSWDGEYVGTEKIEGAKGRLEVHALPALYLDAAIFEDEELNGSDWTVGARLSMPFEVDKISKGKNPFEGAFAKQDKPPFANRLLDMVIRDLHVQLESSGWEENPGARQVQTQTKKKSLRDTIMDDIIFVDGGDGNDGNDGTAENPKETIQNGVDSAFGDRNVYVYAGDYRENVLLDNADSDIQVYGEGFPIKGNGGKSFGGDRYPVLNGTAPAQMPCFRVLDADNVAIRGFELTHDDSLAVPVNDGLFGTYTINFAGIEAENADNLLLGHNRTGPFNSYGALILADGTLPTGVLEYNVTLRNNEFVNNGMDGVLFDVRGSSGLFMLDSRGNDYSGNNQDGIDVNAQNFDAVFLAFRNDRANNSAGADGFDFEDVDNNELVMLAMQNIQANQNDDCGIEADQMDNTVPAQGTFLGLFDGIRASDNGDAGLDLNVIGNAGPAMVLLADGRFNNNGDEGVDIDLVSQNFALAAIGPDGAFFRMVDLVLPFIDLDIRGPGLVVANGNDSDGIDVDITAPNAALAGFFDVRANFNGSDGLEVDCTADNGIAGAVFVPSFYVMEAAQVGVDVITALLGVPSINLPRANYPGPIQAIGNTDNGIDVDVDGYTAAFGAFFDIDTWLNGDDGIAADLDCTLDPAGGVAVALFGGVDAWNNGDDGIDLLAIGRDFSLGAFVDVWAEDNAINGILADIQSPEGIAVGLMATTRLVDDLLNLIGLPFDLGLRGGPNVLNDNGFNGLDLNVAGQNMALALVADTRANDNGNTGFDLDLDAVGAGGDAIALMYDVRALRNNNDGIFATLDADETALAGFLDLRANNNDDMGVHYVANSANGTALGLMGTTRVVEDVLDLLGLNINLGGFGPNEACNNGGTGVALEMNGDTAVGIVLDTVANDNDNSGFVLDAAADNGDAIGALWRVSALRNDNRGIFLDLEGTDGAYGILADFRANRNGQNGAWIEADAANGTALGVIGTTRVVEELVSALGVGNLGLGGRGPNEANNNGNTGVGMYLNGDRAIGIVLDSQANDNQNSGFNLQGTADNGDAIMGAWRLDALRNGNVGIQMEAHGSVDAYGILADFQASENANLGVFMDVDSLAGTAVGGIGTTEFVDWALNLLGAGGSLADAGIGTFGPNAANYNGNSGVQLEVAGLNEAYAVILDTRAIDNGNMGVYVSGAATAGDVYGVLGQVRANRNGNNGIFADFAASDDMIGIFYDIDALNNGNGGLYADLESTGDGTYGVFMNINANGNANFGIQAQLSGVSEVMAGFTDIDANQNGTEGLFLDIDQTGAGGRVDLFMGRHAADDFLALMDALGYVTLPPQILALVPTGPIHAIENGGNGVNVDIDAVGPVNTFMERVGARHNGANGIVLDATSSGSTVNSFFSHCWAKHNGLDGIHGAFASPLAVVVAMDHTGANDNGGDGIELNAAAPITLLDLGGFLSPGVNQMAFNGGLGLNNSGAGTVSAENNWWDGAPVLGVDYGPGVTPPVTWLNNRP